MKVCGSCGRQTIEFVEFVCPGKGCGGKIVRCKACRENSIKWKCGKCGANGP